MQKEDATDGGDQGQMPAEAADAPSRGTRAASRSRASSAAAEVCVQATFAGLPQWLHMLDLPCIVDAVAELHTNLFTYGLYEAGMIHHFGCLT